MSQHSTGSDPLFARRTPPMNVQDKALEMLPEALVKFIKYDASIDWCAVNVYQCYQRVVHMNPGHSENRCIHYLIGKLREQEQQQLQRALH